MPATLAWSSSSTFDESWTSATPDRNVWAFSIPAIADLGPLATLVFCVAGRNTNLGGVDWSADYRLNCGVTVGGVVLTVDRTERSTYESNATLTGVLVGEKGSTLQGRMFKHDFAPGGTVNVTIGINSVGQQMRLEGVITVALLRDFSGLDDRNFFYLGGQSRQIYPPPRYPPTTPDPSPLVASAIIDPAPLGILGLYASDSWSTTNPPVVTAENTPGWEDITTAAAVGLRAAIAVYTPQAAVPGGSGLVTPSPTVTGVTGSQAAETFQVNEYAGNAIVVPLVSIPAKLATIVG